MAVSTMLIAYALEDGSPAFILLFAAACAASSAYVRVLGGDVAIRYRRSRLDDGCVTASRTKPALETGGGRPIALRHERFVECGASAVRLAPTASPPGAGPPVSICFGGPNPGVWAFAVIGTPTRASDRGSGDAQEPAAVVVDCSMPPASRSHLFPYAVKM